MDNEIWNLECSKGSRKGRDHSKNPGIDEIIVEWILEE
jgi:hypothetical protein